MSLTELEAFSIYAVIVVYVGMISSIINNKISAELEDIFIELTVTLGWLFVLTMTLTFVFCVIIESVKWCIIIGSIGIIGMIVFSVVELCIYFNRKRKKY